MPTRPCRGSIVLPAFDTEDPLDPEEIDSTSIGRRLALWKPSQFDNPSVATGEPNAEQITPCQASSSRACFSVESRSRRESSRKARSPTASARWKTASTNPEVELRTEASREKTRARIREGSGRTRGRTATESQKSAAREKTDELDDALGDLNRSTNRLRREFDPTDKWMETRPQVESVLDDARKINRTMVRGKSGTQAERYWGVLRTGHQRFGSLLQPDTSWCVIESGCKAHYCNG